VKAIRGNLNLNIFIVRIQLEVKDARIADIDNKNEYEIAKKNSMKIYLPQFETLKTNIYIISRDI
jgi:hypothetical protein